MDEGQQQLQQQGGDAGAAGQDQGGGTFAPGAMLWLIQRDFLQVGVWEVFIVWEGRFEGLVDFDCARGRSRSTVK